MHSDTQVVSKLSQDQGGSRRWAGSPERLIKGTATCPTVTGGWDSEGCNPMGMKQNKMCTWCPVRKLLLDFKCMSAVFFYLRGKGFLAANSLGMSLCVHVHVHMCMNTYIYVEVRDQP